MGSRLPPREAVFLNIKFSNTIITISSQPPREAVS